VGWLLPIVELAVASLLLLQPLARAGGVAAVLLLTAFIVAVANALRQGRAPDCHCFGQLHSSPAGRGTIARNIALMAPAALVVVGGPGDVLDGAGTEGAALVAVSALAAALAMATITLVRERRLLLQPDAGLLPLDIGTPAPKLRLRDAEGSPVEMGDVIAADRPTVFVFVAPGCGPCKALLPRLDQWRSALAERVELVLISAPPPEGGPTSEAPTWTPYTVWDIENAATRAYRLPGTPAAVLVDTDGAVASAPAMASEAIEALIRVARRPRLPSQRPRAAA
jgi:thiol-disulfide isomerase/thioredoxin